MSLFSFGCPVVVASQYPPCQNSLPSFAHTLIDAALRDRGRDFPFPVASTLKSALVFIYQFGSFVLSWFFALFSVSFLRMSRAFKEI